MKKLFVVLFELFGWKVEGKMPAGSQKCLIVEAPHTCWKDFPIGKAAFEILGLQGNFLIKKEFFRWPFKGSLLSLGAIPVNRGTCAVIDTAVALFDAHETCAIVITPEGTRRYNKFWKKGFYEIAIRAKIPIVIVYVDYKRKVVGIVPELFWPSDDARTDLKRLQDIYRKLNVTAKYPEKYSLSPMYSDGGK